MVFYGYMVLLYTINYPRKFKELIYNMLNVNSIHNQE